MNAPSVRLCASLCVSAPTGSFCLVSSAVIFSADAIDFPSLSLSLSLSTLSHARTHTYTRTHTHGGREIDMSGFPLSLSLFFKLSSRLPSLPQYIISFVFLFYLSFHVYQSAHFTLVLN